MPDRLLIDGIAISGELESAVRRKQQTKIVNRLMNGQPNVQIIGDPTTIFYVTFFAYLAGRETLDSACSDGDEVTLEYHGDTFQCVIEDDEIAWRDFIPDEGNEVFQGQITLIVVEQL